MSLSHRERAVLAVLRSEAPRFVPTSKLASAAGLRPQGLAPLVSRLRNKLTDAQITSRRGSGYRLEQAEDTQRWFVGREESVEELDELLVPGALVTLTGPPGVGKTTLAQRVAGRRASRWVALLAGCRNQDDVAAAVASAMGQAGAEGVLGMFLNQGVLVLDNCEHLVPELSALLASWASTPRRLSILCTSRRPLGVSDERVVSVPPLSRDAARELFRKVSGRDEPEGAEELDAALDRLEGIPLVVELAATQHRQLPLRELLTRLAGEDSPLDRAFRASWRLLEPEDREGLVRLSVFVDSFELSAAEAVVGGTRPTRVVQRLRAHNLLASGETRSGRRLWLLQPILDCVQPLASAEAIESARDAHARYFASCGCLRFMSFHPCTPKVYARYAMDRPDAVAAARHAAQRGMDEVLVGAVVYARSSVQIDPDLRFELEKIARRAALRVGAVATAIELEISETGVLFFEGMPDQALAHAEALLERARREAPAVERGVLRNLAMVRRVTGDLAGALQAFEAMAAVEVEGDPPAFGHVVWGAALRMAGRLDEAEEVLRVYDDPVFEGTKQLGYANGQRAKLAIARAGLGEAERLLESCLEIHRAGGGWAELARVAAALAELAFLRGDGAQQAAREQIARWALDQGVPWSEAATVRLRLGLLVAQPDIPTLEAELALDQDAEEAENLELLIAAAGLGCGEPPNLDRKVLDEGHPAWSHLRRLLRAAVDGEPLPGPEGDRSLPDRLARRLLTGGRR